MNDRPTASTPGRRARSSTITRRVLDRLGPTAKACGIVLAILPVLGLVLGVLASTLGVIEPETPGLSPSAAATAQVQAPAPAPAPAPTTAAPSVPEVARPEPAAPAPTGTRVHRVATGDTLADIAQRYAVPVELIAADNGIADPDRIVVGAALEIAVPPTGVVVVAAGSTLSDHARRHHLSVAEIAALNPQIADPDRIQAGAGLRVTAG